MIKTLVSKAIEPIETDHPVAREYSRFQFVMIESQMGKMTVNMNPSTQSQQSGKSPARYIAKLCVNFAI